MGNFCTSKRNANNDTEDNIVMVYSAPIVSAKNNPKLIKVTKEKVGMICEYWFRTIINNKDITINDITKMILNYHSNITPYSGKFIQTNCGSGIKVINDNQLEFIANSRTNAYKSAKLDTPIDMNENTVYCWNIKMNCRGTSLSMFDFFGVVSDKCNNIGQAPWGGLIDCYGISATAGHVWKGTTLSFTKDSKHTTSILSDQIVTLKLDCQLSRLSLYINDEIIYEPITLPERDAWYPAISLSFPTHEYIVTLLQIE